MSQRRMFSNQPLGSYGQGIGGYFGQTFGQQGSVFNRDSHTRVSYQRNAGYFERVGSSFCGICFGVFVLVAACFVIFWNEGRAVQTAQSLDEGLRRCINIGKGTFPDSANENQLVHLSGELTSTGPLVDDAYGVKVNAIRLKRHVEMYQWVEHKTTRTYDEGGVTRKETSYSYSKEWKSHAINSGTFDNPQFHHNPNSMPVTSKENNAPVAIVGAFSLSTNLIHSVNKWHDLQLTEDISGLQRVGNVLYQAKDPYVPQVGDLKISFQYAGATEGSPLGHAEIVSIIAKQSGKRLTGYQTSAGNVLEMLYMDEKTKEEIFEAEQSFNSMMTWGLRFAGWLIMFIGMSMTTSIITALVSFVPILRDLVGLAVGIVNFILATSLSLFIMALGWIRYRPLVACALIAAAAVPFLLSRNRKKQADQKSDSYQ